jgi:hypothetical protein
VIEQEGVAAEISQLMVEFLARLDASVALPARQQLSVVPVEQCSESLSFGA